MLRRVSVPIFPIFVLAVDNSSDYILPLSPAIQYEENPEELLNLFMDALIMVKVCPAEIIARDKRTYAFAKSFCERMKIPLSINENLPALEDAEITFFERMQKNNDEKIDDIIDMLDQMLELDSTQLRNLPGDMVGQLEAIVKDNVLPENIKNKLNEVFHFEETGFPRLVKSNPQATKPVFKGSYVISVSLGTGCISRFPAAIPCLSFMGLFLMPLDLMTTMPMCFLWTIPDGVIGTPTTQKGWKRACAQPVNIS